MLNNEFFKKIPEGSKIYSRVHGRVGILTRVANDGILVHFESYNGEYAYDCKFLPDGSLIQGGECMLFPVDADHIKIWDLKLKKLENKKED